MCLESVIWCQENLLKTQEYKLAKKTQGWRIQRWDVNKYRWDMSYWAIWERLIGRIDGGWVHKWSLDEWGWFYKRKWIHAMGPEKRQMDGWLDEGMTDWICYGGFNFIIVAITSTRENLGRKWVFVVVSSRTIYIFIQYSALLSAYNL